MCLSFLHMQLKSQNELLKLLAESVTIILHSWNNTEQSSFTVYITLLIEVESNFLTCFPLNKE